VRWPSRDDWDGFFFRSLSRTAPQDGGNAVDLLVGEVRPGLDEFLGTLLHECQCERTLGFCDGGISGGTLAGLYGAFESGYTATVMRDSW
jgi:hypothetical protein